MKMFNIDLTETETEHALVVTAFLREVVVYTLENDHREEAVLVV